MTDQNNQEPTMEEILASIRRIISEDDAPAEDGAPAAEAAPAPVPLPDPEPELAAFEAPEPEAPVEEDVLELTDRVDDGAGPPPVESLGDLDVFSSEPPPAAAAPPLAREPEPPPSYLQAQDDDDALLSPPAATSAATAFAALSSTIGMPRDNRTLEDVTRELLRPLLKQWLDDNLPRIVETAVQNEVERISRQRGG